MASESQTLSTPLSQVAPEQALSGFWPKRWWQLMEFRIGVIPLPVYFLLLVLLIAFVLIHKVTDEKNAGRNFRGAGDHTAASIADWQFWPEVDVSIKLSQRVSVLGMGTLHFGKNVSDLNEEQAGIGFNFTLNMYFSLSPEYRYGRGQPPGRSHTREHRFFLDFTARAPVRNGFVLNDRNRIELRRISGVESHRYRNKLQLERTFSIDDRKLTPYICIPFRPRSGRLKIAQRFIAG